MYKFINNYSEPVVLAAATNTVVLTLPDGKYRLSIADAAQNATRWEILDADVVSGSAALTRALEGTSAQEWPAGSVIYNTITAGIMEMLMAGGGEPVEPDLPAGLVVRDTDGEYHQVTGYGEISGRLLQAVSAGLDQEKLMITGPKLAEVVSWDDVHDHFPDVTEINFQGASNLVAVPDYLPTWMTSISGMFEGCTKLNDPKIKLWDASRLVDASEAFRDCQLFNQDLSGWCVSGITQEPYAFSYYASSWELPKPIWGTCPS